MNNIRFDNENSKCVSAERMTPDELRQLHRMDNEMEAKEKMSYDITFKVKVDGIDQYVPIGSCDANITKFGCCDNSAPFPSMIVIFEVKKEA